MPADRPLTHFTRTSTVNSQSSSEYSNILTQMYSRGKNRAPNQNSYAHRPIDPFSNNHPFYISKLNLNFPKWHTLVPNYKFRFPHNSILTETTPKTPISHKTDTSRYTLVSVNNSKPLLLLHNHLLRSFHQNHLTMYQQQTKQEKGWLYPIQIYLIKSFLRQINFPPFRQQHSRKQYVETIETISQSFQLPTNGSQVGGHHHFHAYSRPLLGHRYASNLQPPPVNRTTYRHPRREHPNSCPWSRLSA